ncbi:MAG: hypothetical protein IKN44_06220 [Bacteroidaceae bacterium]|nr:hypothetical protein [Bacteroidaceae bacterium]
MGYPPILFFVNWVGGCCVYGRKEVEWYGHSVEYDISKYDWDIIANQVASIYRSMRAYQVES